MPTFPLKSTVTLAVALALSAAFAPHAAAIEPSGPPAAVKGWRAVTVAKGVDRPWGMAWLPDGRALVTSKHGKLFVVNGNRFDEVPLEGLPEVFTSGQGGLLDVSVHPGDKDNPRIYMTLATGTSSANRTTLVRGTFDGKRVHGIETLFQARPDKSGGAHFGSRLAWLPDGTLLMSIGDGGNPPTRIGDRLAREQAQNLATHQGSILRLTADGKAAPGNPLAKRPGALPEIWSMGHRNVQGLAVDKATGQVWATEHGPRGGDELNLVVAGQNYGWPLQSYGADYVTAEPVGQREVPGMVGPKVAYVPSPALSGLTVYSGSQFPQWRGSVFSGAMVGMDIRRIAVDKNGNAVRQERLEIGARVRDVKQGPDGHLYALTDEAEGRLLRIVRE
ncbi:PQQ-dependent sugar dehydrogenase [Pseudoduganella sp. GCM10020061]|uniref:PQQ-dependent sugar dehydrogenase n=1 Tax=Pseudoduganella sp. GCM10020061 TaxID=3317345 RepID=UPI003640B73A